MKNYEIKITGIVQGVGFRPFIFTVAAKFNLRGYILNNSSGVFINFEGEEENIKKAVEFIKANNPRGSKLDSIQIREVDIENYSIFEIRKSSEDSGSRISISPDLSICEDCKNEMDDQNSRFFKYPFTSCASCGPRFTILEELPYDRPYTSMVDFEMCEQCKSEYTNPLNRRYHAQTISCSNCGPKLYMKDTENPIKRAVELINEGKILGIKGIGGYHLACDAKNDSAVKILRERKNRPFKPFAVMMKDIETVEKYCIISKNERELLASAESPIVLLKQKENSDISKFVNPNIDSLGVMLAYTPLHKLILEQTEVLVMTSANKSSEPIITEQKTAEVKLSGIADDFLHHDRRIVNGCDDSVVRCVGENISFIRRARGYAVTSIKLDKTGPDILACGGDLKNTFCILKGDNAYLSQYIGDLENNNTLEWYIENIERFKKVLKADIQYVISDIHPEYNSTKFAKKLNLPLLQVQHHHAHVVSVMCEHNINEPVIGVSFDGTGFGDDGNLWGGEFFTATRSEYNRKYHFEYIKMPGGEMAIKEPWRMAVSYLNKSFEHLPDMDFVNSIDLNKLNVINKMIKNNINSPHTSSIGRLFDAVSALTGVNSAVTYEGQAAVDLESFADLTATDRYEYMVDNGIIITKPLIMGIVTDIKKGFNKHIIASKFHNTISEIVFDICFKISKAENIKKVVLSGGVFQNIKLLLQCINKLQKAGLEVFINIKVPTNDGGISLGQIGVGLEKLNK